MPPAGPSPDGEQAADRRDQQAARRDDLAEQRDAAASQRDTQAHARDDVAEARDQVAVDRELADGDRDWTAAERDQVAVARDQAAAARDQAVAERDQAGAERDQAGAAARVGSGQGRTVEQLLIDREVAAAERALAAQDPAAAAEDRATATRDRAAAARDRAAALAERQQAASSPNADGLGRGQARRVSSRHHPRTVGKAQAERLIAPLGDRWTHVQAVANKARSLAAVLAAEDADLLVVEEELDHLADRLDRLHVAATVTQRVPTPRWPPSGKAKGLVGDQALVVEVGRLELPSRGVGPGILRAQPPVEVRTRAVRWRRSRVLAS